MAPRDFVGDWGDGDGGRDLVTRGGTANLADILERVLDKGVVVAGDIVVSLVDIELLTIRLRLLIASVDKAKEMGIDWWTDDPWLNAGAREADREAVNGHSDGLGERLARLEDAVDRLSSALESGRPRRSSGDGSKRAASGSGTRSASR